MLWCDVYGVDGVKVGDGPVLIESASVTRALDGAGNYNLEMVYSEAVEGVMQVGRSVFLYMQTPNADGELDKRLIAQGIIRKRKMRYSTNPSFTVEGPELLDELKYTSVLLNRQYNNVALATVVQALVALGGWTATVAISDILLASRFDGVSVLKALQEIAKQNGLHFRQGEQERVLEWGAFGANNGVTLISTESANAVGDGIGIIESIQLDEEGDNVINWLLPVGAGEGEAALTLKKSTRSGVETITGADNKPLYYVKDDASIAKYGTRQKAGIFKEIAPLDNNEPSKILAANALYDASVAYLARYADPVKRYSVVVKRCNEAFKVGDKVRVKYNGLMRTIEGDDVFTRIDEDLWIMRVNESYGQGYSVSLELANVDQAKQDSAKVIVGALENIELKNLKPQTYPYWATYVYTDLVSNNFIASQVRYADFKIKIDNGVTDITRIKISFVTKVIYQTTQGYQTAGVFTLASDGTVGLHTHELNTGILYGFFNVAEGSNYPSDITLYINGVDVSATFGGPWNPSPTNAQWTLDADITDIILATGNIYATHTVQVRCGQRTGDARLPGGLVAISGDVSHGLVEATITVQGICQAILSS